MKRITNINDPNNVIIVSDAYINGNRIVCITETDEFDLWRNCWKLEELTEQPVEGLEEAAENYIAPIENDEGLDYINFNGRDIKDAFIAGAEWQKAKMLEDAVEIEVKEDAGGYPIVPLDAIELYDYENDKPLAKAGDKVRVIVIKED